MLIIVVLYKSLVEADVLKGKPTYEEFRQCKEYIQMIGNLGPEVICNKLRRNFHQFALSVKTEFEKTKENEQNEFLRKNCDDVDMIAEMLEIKKPRLMYLFSQILYS